MFFLFGEVCGGPLLLLPVFGGSLPCPSLLPGGASQWASLSVCWRSGSGSEGSPSRPATNAGKPEVAQPDAPGTLAAAMAAHLQRLTLSLGRINVRANCSRIHQLAAWPFERILVAGHSQTTSTLATPTNVIDPGVKTASVTVTTRQTRWLD